MSRRFSIKSLLRTQSNHHLTIDLRPRFACIIMARSNLESPNPSALDLNFTSTTNRDSHVQNSPVVNPAPCVGKTVFITGAAREMGQATVISFAAAGADRIAIMDRVDASATHARALQAAADAGRPIPEVLVLEVDVCDVASVEAGVKEVSSRWGHVDVLINNAGDLSPFEPQPLGASDMDAWWRTWEVNVKGIYVVVRALLPLLLQGTEKTIVNMISIGSLALMPGASAYQLSKLAVMRLSECLMLDHAHCGLLAYSMHMAPDLANGMPEAASNGMSVG